MRPGLWSTFVDIDDGMNYSRLWAIWVWDGASSQELLNQTIQSQEIDDFMKEMIAKRSSNDYAHSLDWHHYQRSNSGDDGVALRFRHLSSPEFQAFVNRKAVLEDETDEQWQQTILDWFKIDHESAQSTRDELSGVLIGGVLYLIATRMSINLR